MRSWDFLERFAALGARGSATPAEKRAAAWLQRELGGLGYDVELQQFTSPRHTLYLGPAVVIGLMLLAAFMSPTFPIAATVLAVLGLVPLVGEMLGSKTNFNVLLPKRLSQNVVARPPEDDRGRGDEGRDVVIVAHYDTQWGSWLFAPAFAPFLKPFFILTYVGLVLTPVGIVLRATLPAAAWPSTLLAVAVGVQLVTGLFLVGSVLTGRAVPGANDNGSGVAVALALAAHLRDNPPSRLRPTFLFTGCEEVGLRGMHHFLETQSLSPSTVFVNLDNVGGGTLRFLLGEGMLGYTHYDAELIGTARGVARNYDGRVAPLKNLLLPTDGLLPANAGYPSITFLAAGADGAIPHYHWHSDTLENVDRDVVEVTERFLRDFLSELDGTSAENRDVHGG